MKRQISFLLWTMSFLVSKSWPVVAVNMADGIGEYAHHHEYPPNPPREVRCQKVSIPMCSDVPYNMTMFPNLLGHATQEEAGYEVHEYYALVKVSCHPNLQIFLCSLFAPFCNILGEPVPPCQGLCEQVKSGCEQVMLTFGFPWPASMDCSQFPKNSDLCVTGNKTSDLSFNGTPRNASGVLRTTHQYIANTVPSYADKAAICPTDWVVLEHSIGNDLTDCGPPCTLFTQQQKHIAGIVVGVFATSTLISSLFTIITAILDSNRFHYPERAIVHLAVCYAALAICYIVGAIGSSEISCHEGFVVVGPGSASCTLLFMFTYFLTFASHIWWVLLSLTWYLSAGLKWGGEAIAAYSLYFHLSAWGISAFLTMAAVALGYVEGDPLAGPCSLGIQKSPELQYFMMYPLMLLITIGTIFFIMGFSALFRIRGEIKRSSTVASSVGSDKVFSGHGHLLLDQPQDNVIREGTARLEFLMARIGVFSILYTVPAVVFLVALYYISTPLSDGGVLIPIIGSQQRNNHKLFIFYLVRYISNLSFGSALIIWVWSRKTLMTWKKAICRPNVK